MRASRVIGVIALLLLVCLLAGTAVALVVFPNRTAQLVEPLFPGLAQSIAPDETVSSHHASHLNATLDADLPTEQEEAAYLESHKGHPTVNPLIAQCEGVDLNSPIDPADLTGVLFHQASYPYALVMTTELPDGDLDLDEEYVPPAVNHDQMEGIWLDAQALHIWRTSDTMSMDTSVDVGAAAGTTLKSPVTGTVVLVRDYLLYDRIPDVELHIQPDGRTDLDVVIIHTENPLVAAGDHVEGGVTPLASVRDIAADLYDIQLSYYTADDDPGNHTHIQVNNADYPDYRETRLQP